VGGVAATWLQGIAVFLYDAGFGPCFFAAAAFRPAA
jgi:hypothetical protein